MAAKKAMNVWIAEHLGLATVGAFVLILALGYVLLFAPEMRRIRAANRLGFLRQEYELKQKYLGDLTQLDKSFSDVPKEDVDRLVAMIPAKQDVPGLLASLEASANASAMAMTAVNFSRGERPVHLASVPNLDTVTIAITLEHAGYHNFKLFLEALEDNLRLFDVVSASLNPSAAQYTLILRAYVRASA